MTKLTRPMLQLYAQCLRSARRCPQWEQREMMKAYLRMKFRDEVNAQNPDRLQALLADGREELERMNYYHSIYEANQRSRTNFIVEPSFFSLTSNQRPISCSQCKVVYPSEEANFCGYCGTKRS